jgi:predicted dienelactone hydrolase
MYTAELLRDRPRHLLRALETVLASPDFAPYVDESRIGLLGVGFGSITVLQLAGAMPDFSRLRGYCPGGEDYAGDAFCPSWTRQRLLELSGEMAALERGGKGGVFNPRLDIFSPALIPVAVPPEDAQLSATEAASAQSDTAWWRRIFRAADDAGAPAAQPELSDPAGEEPETAASDAQTDAAAASAAFPLLPDFQGGPLFGGTDSGASFVHIALPDSPQFRVTVSEDAAGSMASPDPIPGADDSPKRVYRRPATVRSIRGIALLAPAGGMLFRPAELGRIQAPVAMVEGEWDTLYPAARHAQPYRDHLTTPPRLLPLARADHFSLFARCSGETMLNLREACGRLTGKERERLAEERDQFLVSFFQSVLGGALPAAGPSGYVAAPRE